MLLQATAGFLQAAGVRFNSFFSRDQRDVATELVKKFHADLGKAFTCIPSSAYPPPSFEMERCLYHTLAHDGGAPDLTRCVTAHSSPIVQASTIIISFYPVAILSA